MCNGSLAYATELGSKDLYANLNTFTFCQKILLIVNELACN